MTSSGVPEIVKKHRSEPDGVLAREQGWKQDGSKLVLVPQSKLIAWKVSCTFSALLALPRSKLLTLSSPAFAFLEGS